MKLFVLSLALLSNAFAQNYCTEWTAQRHVSCVFMGNSATSWERQCENPCGWRDWGPHCQAETICMKGDPNELETPCTKWERYSGETCYNPGSGKWEQKWGRACQVGLRTTWCSDERPEF
jgi:hypothetical protein